MNQILDLVGLGPHPDIDVAVDENGPMESVLVPQSTLVRLDVY